MRQLPRRAQVQGVDGSQRDGRAKCVSHRQAHRLLCALGAHLHWHPCRSPLRRAAQLGGQERQDDAGKLAWPRLFTVVGVVFNVICAGLLAVRAGLRVPHTGQCFSGAQAGHQSAEEGQSARDAGGQDESADTQDHLSRIEDHVRHAQGLCDIVTNHEAQLSTDFIATTAATAAAA